MKTAAEMLAAVEKLAGERETGSGNNTTVNKYWNAEGAAYCGYTIWYADRMSGKPYLLDGCQNPAWCRSLGEWLTSKGWRLKDNRQAAKGDIAFYCEYNKKEKRWMYQHVFFIYEKVSGTTFITLEGNNMVFSTAEKARLSTAGTGAFEGIGYKKRNMPTGGTWAIFHPPYGEKEESVEEKRVYLSPSDQKRNTYAVGNTTEDVQCGKIAAACKTALERSGVKVMVGQYDTMANRCKASDTFKANLHVPIHTNAANGKASGTRIFCYKLDKNSEGYKAAKAVFDVLAPLTPGKSENIKANPNLFEVKTPAAPTVYIEVDFHDVPDVAQWIIDNTEVIGETIAKGICNYLGVTFKAAASKPATGKVIYRVQVGAFSVKANAEAYLKKVQKEFPEAFITEVKK
nr:MAG TPA: Cell wall hydrolase autolysin [Caudoviricetes sp.]